MPDGEDICYTSHRKPYFKNASAHLSISHSFERVAVCIHEDKNIGVDLQLISEKILRIKEKFLNSLELVKAKNEPTELTAYWSIKEALFKIYGKQDAFLKPNFEIKNFNFDGKVGSAKGIIRVNSFYEEHHMEFRKMDNYMLAYSANY